MGESTLSAAAISAIIEVAGRAVDTSIDRVHTSSGRRQPSDRIAASIVTDT
jgi:hypothetical protein